MSTPVSYLRKDIADIFKRDDIRGIWPDKLNCDVTLLIGRCLASMLMRPDKTCRIVVGHDARTGSYELLCALCRGLEEGGATVRNLGICSSEQVYYMAGRYADEFDGGAMITASHNPAQYNGIKIIHSGSLPFNANELNELRRRLEDCLVERKAEPVSTEYADYMFNLADCGSMKAAGDTPIKVVIGAGHGVGALAFRPMGELLSRCGFQFEYLDDEPDGAFPEGVPNPLLPAFNARLGAAVKAHHAAMGIGFDGDADRAGFIDENGVPLISSQVLAIVASSKLETARHSGISCPVIMKNPCCSHLLEDLFSTVADVELIDTPVGHGQIKQLMRSDAFRKRVIIAGEHSGHYYYPEFFSVDSGILSSLYMLKHLKRIHELRQSLSQGLEQWRRQYLWSGEINFKMPDADSLARTLEAFRHYEEGTPGRRRFEIRKDPAIGLARLLEADSTDTPATSPDVKVQLDNGQGGGWWFVIRPSGNEPILRLNAEIWNLNQETLSALVADLERIIMREGGQKA